jgi:flagellar basal body-associated protein FliL
MAKDKPKPAEGAEQPADSAAPGKKKGLMPILIVGALMLVEGVAVFLVVGMLGGPKQSVAAELQGQASADQEAATEIKLFEGRCQNLSTGRVWVWNTEIFLRVREKNKAKVEETLKRDAAAVQEGISLIFRRAHDRHLRESGMETLNRQLTAWVNQQFGTDADGMSIVDRVIIAKLEGMPGDI